MCFLFISFYDVRYSDCDLISHAHALLSITCMHVPRIGKIGQWISAVRVRGWRCVTLFSSPRVWISIMYETAILQFASLISFLSMIVALTRPWHSVVVSYDISYNHYENWNILVAVQKHQIRLKHVLFCSCKLVLHRILFISIKAFVCTDII